MGKTAPAESPDPGVQPPGGGRALRVLLADDDAPDRMVAQQVGFDHYLVKPCDPAELLRLLRSSASPAATR